MTACVIEEDTVPVLSQGTGDSPNTLIRNFFWELKSNSEVFSESVTRLDCVSAWGGQDGRTQSVELTQGVAGDETDHLTLEDEELESNRSHEMETRVWKP